MHNRGSIPQFPFVSGAERVTGEEREPLELASGRKSLSCRLRFTVASRKNERGEEALNFFISIFFFDLSKIYVAIFFFQKCHPAAGWFGGKELPPDEPAVR